MLQEERERERERTEQNKKKKQKKQRVQCKVMFINFNQILGNKSILILQYCFLSQRAI
jgi:hypothetical protein